MSKQFIIDEKIVNQIKDGPTDTFRCFDDVNQKFLKILLVFTSEQLGRIIGNFFILRLGC